MVYRIFVEKKPGLDNEARALENDAKTLLGIQGLEKVRLLNRYDAENISEELFNYAVKTVFSEPQLDIATTDVDTEGATVFAVEYLPGQFDQRADSAAQCIQIISRGERPLIHSARLYVLYGSLTDAEIAEAKFMQGCLSLFRPPEDPGSQSLSGRSPRRQAGISRLIPGEKARLF